MHWIYILQCENDYYYVGETSRLYRRFWEHQGGIGGINTSAHSPEKIVAIYRMNNICNFIDYNEYVSKIIDGVWHENYKNFKLRDFNNTETDSHYEKLYAENNIAECLMIHKKDEWNKIRGGKYVRFDIDYKYPNNDYIKELPLCNCGLPCDINKNDDDNYLYFRCAKKNMWDKFREDFNIYDEPCNYFMEYTKDKQLKIQADNNFKERSNTLKELFKKSYWLKNIEVNDVNYPNQCVGGCNRTTESIKLTYNNEKRNLCFDCFINKNEELSNKYNNQSIGKCLIKIKKN